MSTRRKFIFQGSLAATALIAAKPLKVLAQKDSTSFSNRNSIVIVHTPDLTAKNASQAAEIIAKLKSEKRNVLLLDAGKCASEGLRQVKSKNQLGLEAGLPYGTHFSEQTQAETPAVLSHYQIDSCLDKQIKPYRIIRKGTIKVGIIGAANVRGVNGIVYKNPLKEVSALAVKLKEKHQCHLVICISDLGTKTKSKIDDRTLARLSNNIDVILGRNPEKQTSQTSVVLNKNGEEVIINHAGKNEDLLGQIEIGFDKNGKKSHVSFNNMSLLD